MFVNVYIWYHRWSSTSFGVVQELSSSCPKNGHHDTASLEPAVGGQIGDVAPIVQIVQASVVGSPGSYFGMGHGLFPIHLKTLGKPVLVPTLEQCHIEAHM